MKISHDALMKVMVIGDGSVLETELCDWLRDCGHDVHQLGFKNNRDMAVLVKPEMILVNLSNVDLSGADCYRQLNSWTGAPVIALASGNIKEVTKIKVLDAGADDLLLFPFGRGELMARIRAIRRRIGSINHDALSFKCGDVRIDFAQRAILSDDGAIPLTPNEYKLLRCLVLNKNRIVSHKQLLAEVSEQNGEASRVKNLTGKGSHLLRVHINNLRNKLEKDPQRPEYIKTETRLGYRFRAW
jgi:two-component system KDP operon response regulator KdpE